MLRSDPYCRSVLICLILLVGCPLWAFSIEEIQVLRISPQDERAVVRVSDGTFKVIKIGDFIGEKGRVVEIAEGRVVIEEITDRGKEIIIIRIESGKQRIERIRKVGDKEPTPYSPIQNEKPK